MVHQHYFKVLTLGPCNYAFPPFVEMVNVLKLGWVHVDANRMELPCLVVTNTQHQLVLLVDGVSLSEMAKLILTLK